MEAAEKTLTHRDDTGLHVKLLALDKNKNKNKHRDDPNEKEKKTHSDESNYVDLDMKPDGPKTVKVTFTGEGSQLSVSKNDSSNKVQEERKEKKERKVSPNEIQGEDIMDAHEGPLSGESPLETLTKLPNKNADQEDSGNEKQIEPSDCSEHGSNVKESESDELQYTDMYLHSRTESDGALSELSERSCASEAALLQDESHYITTHEIQLTELDHDVDYDLGRGTGCWDFEDDNFVYSFVDYASFESDESQEGTLVLEGRRGLQTKLSTEQEESDLCDSDKCASSDESVCKTHSGEDDLVGSGKIHLSIKTSSRAVKEPVIGVFENSSSSSNLHEYAQRFGDQSHFSFVSSGARAHEPLCDTAGPYFIPAPCRQHLATKLRRKDINEYSSGASSSISELDDADKEVRNLTAKSFRSLACPYFDAINLSTSSESSLSEYGLNKWSAYVDWNYGNISQGKEGSVIAHKTSSATLEMNRTVDSRRRNESATSTEASSSHIHAFHKKTDSQQVAASSSKRIQLKDPSVQPSQRGVTLNFRCNVESHDGRRSSRCSKKARPSDVTGTVLARSGCKVQYHRAESTEDTHKRAIFASSLLQNVISKKMQFEQERKMERGEIRDTHPPVSPCFYQDGLRENNQGKGLQRQTSDSGSTFTVNSEQDEQSEDFRHSPSGPEETTGTKTPDHSEKEQDEHQKTPLISNQSSAFNALKEEEPQAVKEAGFTSLNGSQYTAKEGVDTSSMLSKLLFVPSCQLLPKDRDSNEAKPPTGSQKIEKELKNSNDGYPEVEEQNGKQGKSPGIKICLRSVKENKGGRLNIANLLTPKISYNLNTLRTVDDTRFHLLPATDKVPNFTVRDVRDNKCKFQTPIYHVRDVRKLVKSSYRFISLDNSDSKCSTTANKLEEKTKVEPPKHVLPSPIVIKCNSVKTNAKSPIAQASQKEAEADAPSEISQNENTPLQSGSSRVPTVVNKQGNPDQSEVPPNVEGKLLKLRLDKFAGEASERRNEATMPKQGALEKLKAAVKTMEQLYVFDQNEWKRKTQPPRPVTDSHVLSVIASEMELEPANRIPKPSPNTTETRKPQGDKRAANIIHVPYTNDGFNAQSQQSKTFTKKSTLHFGNKTHVSINSDANPVPQTSALLSPSAIKSSKKPVAPLSVKIEPPKHGQVEQGNSKTSPTNPTVTPSSLDSENYLTIPGLGRTNESKPLNREEISSLSKVHAGESKEAEQKKSPLIMEYPAATIYHHSTAVTSPQKQPQLLCFSPSGPTVSPTPSAGERAPQTQRKMLLDPTTGHYYLVDTPIQPSTKRLFDPDTGQYVDVPMTHSPVAPVTPVPLSLSPLALSPPAYAPTYMIYPGFIPSPTLAAQAVMPQSPCQSEHAAGENVKNASSPRLESTTAGAESSHYSPIREAQRRPLQLGRMIARGSSERKPLISITRQQGPRIIAPPSFDGKTMSFVVEHR
ncbi:uncharacterized protein C4orf54-like [Cololabis saira]|uniref:uncharacterized protein C4orf54-like n=1 Tax=Cololabis saira TaxID=129043 RepID=UPI002AD32C46|nr:uncharacterized protein C4orf54-like [Cololabis saira]